MRWEGDKGGRAGSEEKIARELGLTDGVVHGIIFNSSGPDAEKAKADHYRNKALREVRRYRSRDSVDRETRVLARWAAGASAGDIAKEFRVSANVVIGIVHRATGDDAEAAKRAHAAILQQRPSASPPWRNKPSALTPQSLADRREKQASAGQAFIAKVELRLIDNPQFVARVEQPADLYAHMRTERGYQDAIRRAVAVGGQLRRDL